MQIIEEWKDIPGYEGLYKASSLGRIKSLERKVKHPICKNKTIGERILKDRKNSRGYMYTGLSTKGVVKSKTIHRLVCMAFYGSSNKTKAQVNHINGDTTDNRLVNLEWVTASENQIHAVRGKKNPKQKLSVCDVIGIKKMLREGGKTHDEIAIMYKVNTTTISRISTGTRWGHV